MPKTASTDKTPTFENALDELEDIVTRMEEGRLTLEQSLASYKRGAELLKLCQSQLTQAQKQVKVLEAGALKNFTGDNDDNND